MDLDPDSDPHRHPNPAIFVTDLKDGIKKLIKKSVSAFYFLKAHLHLFSKIKSPKEASKQ
jgi:hypothetical protein